MARQRNNIITYGISGKVGDFLLFRQRNGKTIISRIPRPPKTASEKQQAQRARFQQAVIYGKALSPELLQMYKNESEKGRVPFTVAVADFLNAPDVEQVDLSNYTGQPGDTITILASDDFKIKSVHLRVTNADGSLVEEGEAQPDASGHAWTYTATRTNDNLEGDKIEINVSDLPGNITREEHLL
jgi:hypothetical protein